MSTFHSLWTLVLFLLFIAIVAWAWDSRRKKSFEQAAMRPLLDDESTDGENKDG